ncbi:putative bifunctional diguanylate cyclase/phosphodiesterase [Saccharospirillum impatiens]|uniref:putative bifunctional diguanylate cyclase/phosphodiesterase n=1 Tax=Saccharospirillum impatiens TaxID=169438 RepID=UPI00040F4B77|nr:EAL domain-containing protein [Saccharospirillum impatiens]
MQSVSHSFRQERQRQVLRHSNLLWVSSLAMGLVCTAVHPSRPDMLLVGGLIVVLALAGLALSRFGLLWQEKVTGFRVMPAVVVMTALQSSVWGYEAHYGGLCLTLSIAYVGMASIALYAHWRAFLAAWAPVMVLPMFVGPPLPTETLIDVHLPLMSMVLLGAWQGHLMARRATRRALVNKRLNALLARNRDTLEATVGERTRALHQSNERLQEEVALRKQVNQSLIKHEEQMNLAMTASGIGFWDWDITARRVYHSDQHRFFGETASAEDGVNLVARVHPDDRCQVKRALSAHLTRRSDFYHARYRLLTDNDAEPVWLEDSGRVIERSATGQAVRMVGTRRDISSDMRQREELRLSASLFNNSSDGVFVLGRDQRFKTANRMFSQIVGMQKSQLLGRDLFAVMPTHQSQHIAKALLNNGRWHGDLVIRVSGSRRIQVLLTLTAVRSKDRSISHFLGICQDLSQRYNGLIPTDKDAYDALTGVYNRRFFQELLSGFHQHEPLLPDHYAIAILNLDDFAALNRHVGTDTGDQLLRDVAARLTNQNDPLRWVARLGGDRFGLFLEYEGDRTTLEECLNALLQEVARPMLIDDQVVSVTASIGVCRVQSDNIDTLLTLSQQAMIQASAAGGNGINYHAAYPPGLPQLGDAWAREFRQALDGQLLRLDFWPRTRLESGRLEGVDARVSWHHPVYGRLESDVLLSMAQSVGLGQSLQYWYLCQSCTEAVRWQREGCETVRLSLRLASNQLDDDDFVDQVSAVLAQTGLASDALELVVTESQLMADVTHVRGVLDRLSRLGVKLVLGDFGAGQSSLSHLKHLPVDALSLAQNLVREAVAKGQQPVLKAVIEMAHSLNLAVVASPVEQPAQLRMLKKLGCDIAQGGLVSQALSADTLLALVKQRHQMQLAASPIQVH